MPSVTSRKEIPTAACYVLCDDPFIGDTLILPCHDWREAECVKAHAEKRGDHRNIRTVYEKPRLSAHKTYRVHTAEEYEHWYKLCVTITHYESGSFRFEYHGAYEGDKYPHTLWASEAPSLWDALNVVFENAHKAGYRHLSIRWINELPEFL